MSSAQVAVPAGPAAAISASATCASAAITNRHGPAARSMSSFRNCSVLAGALPSKVKPLIAGSNAILPEANAAKCVSPAFAPSIQPSAAASATIISSRTRPSKARRTIVSKARRSASPGTAPDRTISPPARLADQSGTPRMSATPRNGAATAPVAPVTRARKPSSIDWPRTVSTESSSAALPASSSASWRIASAAMPCQLPSGAPTANIIRSSAGPLDTAPASSIRAARTAFDGT